MGSSTPGALLLLLLLAASLLRHLLAAAPQTQLSERCTCRDLISNFDCRINGKKVLSKSWSRCQHKLQEGPSQPLPALVLSTVQCCQNKQQMCLRVFLALNSTGIDKLSLGFFVQNLNQYRELLILKNRTYKIIQEPVWQLQIDNFQVESGWEVKVFMQTLPPGRLNLSQHVVISGNESVPEFKNKWVPTAHAIEVSVPKGPNMTVRLCLERALECKSLRQPFQQQEMVSVHHPVVLRYELLLPCLCLEAFYDHVDSLRKKECPFHNQPEAYANLWSSMQFYDYSSSEKDEMTMFLRSRCFLQPTPTATLCWKESAAPGAPCQDIPNSTAAEADKASMPLPYADAERLTIPIAMYILEKVDVNPQLCFKFSYKNTSHVECPNKTDTTWNVSLSAKFLQLHLTIHSRVSASFSSAVCQQLPSGQCKPEPPIYSITHLEVSALGELDLILPWKDLGICVLVWRSDTRFAGKRMLCPDVSHRRWGLLAFGVGLGLGFLAVVILLIHWNMHGLHRGASSWHHSRPILLIYSPDSEEHKQLVCAFAALLRSALGCPVLLDLWELGHVGRLGILPWLYAQREHVGQKQGQVLLLWSAGSARAYRLWQGEASREGRQAPEPHDLFGAAMACLHSELQGTSGSVHQSDWVIAYFSKLCGRRDIPCALRFLPCYRLPQELPDLVRVLQGNSDSAPNWLRASAKALVGRLLKAEKKSQRQQLNQLGRKSTKRLDGSQVPLAHHKPYRPSCT